MGTDMNACCVVDYGSECLLKHRFGVNGAMMACFVLAMKSHVLDKIVKMF